MNLNSDYKQIFISRKLAGFDNMLKDKVIEHVGFANLGYYD